MSRRLDQRRRKWERQRAVAGQPDAALHPDEPTSQAEPEAQPFHAGGIGGLPIVNPLSPVKDLNLLRRAVRSFPVKSHHRKLVVEEMAAIIEKMKDEPRQQIAAAKVLVAAEQVNVSREKTEVSATNVNVVVPMQIVEYRDHPPRELTSHQDDGTIEYT